MRTRLLIIAALGALLGAAPAKATLIWFTPAVHDCAFATDDTVRVDVMLNGTDVAIGAGGCTISYDDSKLEFVRADRGSLVLDWPTFTATGGAQIVIDAAGGTQVPAHVSGAFAKLVFLDKCCGLASVQDIPLCVQASTGDLATATSQCGTVTCVPGSPGSLTVESVYHTCAGTDTVEVDVRVENNAQPIDAAGTDILYNSLGLQYVGFRRGSLTQAWPFFDAAQINNIIRVGGFTSTPIPAATTGVFVTLRFVLNCCNGPGGITSLCTQLLVDDFAPLAPGCGEVTCVPLATQPSSWGYVKSLYR